jgi:hypothetical protein
MCPRCTILAKAEFEEFVWRDHLGRVQFANNMRPHHNSGEVLKRFRQRVWPVFARTRRSFGPRLPLGSPCGQKVTRSIIKSSNVSAARRWLPCNPLFAHAMQVEDAWREMTEKQRRDRIP